MLKKLVLPILLLVCFSSYVGADEWDDSGFNKDDSYESWYWQEYKFKLNDAVNWKRSGFKPEEAKSWRDANFSISDAVVWGLDAGLDPSNVASWRKAGFDAKAAAEWNTRFAPAEAKEWRAGFQKADEAYRWKNAGIDLATALGWKKRGVGLDAVKELSSIADDLCQQYEALSQANQALKMQFEIDATTGTTNLYERRQIGAAKLYTEKNIERLKKEYKKLSGGDFSRKKKCE